MELLKYHALALLAGYVLDLIIGDPQGFPHIIRLIGTWIFAIEKRIYKNTKLRGFFLVLLVVIPVTAITFFMIYICYRLGVVPGIIVEMVLSYYCLATKSLYVESKLVIDALNGEGLVFARKKLSMIVGRDTENLSETEVIKAAVETVAENTSDGVVAPLFYLCLGGPVLGLLYKSVNTMDSMVGYKNDRYTNYGFFAAKLDDIFNFIPARLCAFLIIICAYIIPGFNGRNAFRIWKRDRHNHKSPNSAQSEAAYAGAMEIKLAGGAYYFGKWVDKPFIGDEINIIKRTDVSRSHYLLYGTSILCEILCMVAIFIIIK